MSWSISTEAPFEELHEQLLAELDKADTDDAALTEAAITAVMPFLSLIGDPSIDENVKVKLSGDSNRKVTISMEHVDDKEPELTEDQKVAKQRNDNLGLVNASTPDDAGLVDAQLRSQDLEGEIMHAQYEATGSLLPEEGEPTVVDAEEVYEAADVMAERDEKLQEGEPADIELGLVMRSVADSLPDTPYDPADYTPGEYNDGSLTTYDSRELHALRVAEENGLNRLAVLAHIDAALGEVRETEKNPKGKKGKV